MKDKQLRVLVTGAGGPLGVNFTRSLREAPRHLYLVGTDANRWHLPLAITDRIVRIPPARELEGYARAMQQLVSEGIDVLAPTHPVEVRAIAHLVESGQLEVATAIPRLKVLEQADDKYATQQILQSAGVPVPRTILLHDMKDLEQAFEELSTPIWVRGSGAPGLGIGGAALPCRDIEVARAWIKHYDAWGKMVACAYLPGRNLSWMSAFSKGKLLASAARERLEYVIPHVSPSGITGAPAVSRTLRRADLAELGERAVRALDDCPNGVYFVDFKASEDGTPHVTEINAGRCGTTVHHYTTAGFNFPWLLTCVAAGLSLDWLPDSPYDVVPEDQYWVRTLDCGPVLVDGTAAFDTFESIEP